MKRGWTETMTYFLSSPANLTGLALASLALAARLTGVIDAYWLLIVAGSYGLGLQIGRLAFPRRLNALDGEEARVSPVLRTEAERTDIDRSLNQVILTVNENQSGVFDPSLQQCIMELCSQIRNLIERMEASTGFISIEDAYSAKRIALDYLPGLINSFVAIPGDFAARKVLADGKTARELLKDNLIVLQRKAAEMADDLAAQDARSFLNHAGFLQDKFGQTQSFIRASGSKSEW